MRMSWNPGSGFTPTSISVCPTFRCQERNHCLCLCICLFIVFIYSFVFAFLFLIVFVFVLVLVRSYSHHHEYVPNIPVSGEKPLSLFLDLHWYQHKIQYNFQLGLYQRLQRMTLLFHTYVTDSNLICTLLSNISKKC